MAMIDRRRQQQRSSDEADAAAGLGSAATAAMTKMKHNDDTKLSKRQHQKQLAKNDKNRWLIQHPKIQNMDVRERVQIKDAGLKVSNSEQQKAGSNSNNKSIVDPQLDMINSTEVKFGRLLGGTDQRQRHAAVRKLKLWLKARCDPENVNGGISEIDLLKLWKALWYTLYMADKVPVQDELSKQLVSLLWCVAGTPEEDEFAAQQYVIMDDDYDELGNEYDDDEEEVEEGNESKEMETEENGDEEEGSDDDDDDEEDDPEVTLEEIENTLEDNDDEHGEDSADSDSDGIPSEEVPHCRGVHLVSLFIRTFFRTIRRDWHKMDKYRIDKFYTLIRHMVHEMYSYLQQRQWHFGMIRMFNDVVFEEVLRETPNGLRYHLIDISLEELAKVAATTTTTNNNTTSDSDDVFTTDVFIDVIEPFLAMSQTGAKDDTVQQRVMERIFERFLDHYSVVSDNALQQKQKEEDESKNGKSVQKKNKGNKKKDDDRSKDSNDASSATSSSSSSSSSSPIFRHVSVTQISQFIFGLGSDIETNDRYRKSLYDMHKKYAKRLKMVGDDVDVVDEDKEDDGDVCGICKVDQDSTPQFMEDIMDANDDKVDNAEAVESPNKRIVNDDADGEESSIKKKKKKKKKRKSSERDDMAEEEVNKNDETATESTPEVSDSTNTKSKKKRKKNTDSKAPPSPLPMEEEEEREEVILISLSEQRQAKKREDERSAAAITPKQKPDAKRQKDDKAMTTPGGSKRVKWDKANKAISHKASMKALKSATPPPTKERTPEKGILREGRHQPKQKQPQHRSFGINNKGGRKKASDYW